MRYSGIVVRSRPADLAAVEARLAELADLEVYARDAATGRLVVVHEARDLDQHEARLRDVQAMPGVASAELVVHVEDPCGADGGLVQVDGPAGGGAAGAEAAR